MAIDPSISLGIRPVEPVDITKLQQIRNLAAQEEATRQSISASQAQEALARAQLPGVALQQERVAAEIPGVRATAEQLVRAQKARTLATENAPRFVDPKTGEVDRRALSNFMSKSGYPEAGDEILKPYLDNLSIISNQETAAQTRAINDTNLLNDTIRQTANSLQFIKDPNKQAEMVKRNTEYINSRRPGLGDQIALSIVGPTAIPADPNAPRNFIPDPERIKAINDSTMTPLEAANLKNAQTQLAQAWESINQSGILNVTGPQARDANSNISRLWRDAATRMGYPGVTERTSAADLQFVPGLRDFIVNDQIPAGTRASLLTRGTELRASTERFKSAAEVVQRLINRGELSGKTVVSVFLQQKIATLGNDPDFRSLQAKLDELNKENPSLGGFLTADALKNSLGDLAKRGENEAKTLEEQIKTGRFTELKRPEKAGQYIAPRPGDIRLGGDGKRYVFRGGDDTKKENWQLVKEK